VRGIRAYEKAGFRKEGVLRQDVFRAGRYWDTILMAILRQEWEQQDRAGKFNNPRFRRSGAVAGASGASGSSGRAVIILPDAKRIGQPFQAAVVRQRVPLSTLNRNGLVSSWSGVTGTGLLQPLQAAPAIIHGADTVRLGT